MTNPSTAAAQQVELLQARFPERLVPLAGGAQVAVRECGPRDAASTIVLLHGISSGAASWLHAVLPLAQAHRVIAWDAPGYGASSPLAPPVPRSDDYAQRLAEVLQVLEVKRFTLAGHSLGSLMACAYARLAPQTLRSLLLLSPARGYGGNAEQSAKVRGERLASLEKLGVEGLAARIDQRLLSPAAGDDARAWVRWNTARLQPQGYAQAVEMLCNSELGTLPAGLDVAVHVGDADVVTTPAACEQAARALGARFGVIAGAGHATPIEQPAAITALLQEAASHG